MKEQMNVPKLRFDEFDTQWKPMPLGEITSYLKGFAFKSEDYLSSGHADSRLIRVSDLSSESVKIDNQKVFLPQELMESSTKYKLKDDDVLITTVGSKPELRESAVGRAIYINKAHGYLNQNLLIMRPKGEHLPRFIFSQLNTPRYINHITNIQRGNANQSNITVVDLFEYRVSTTSLPEQQKIASFLSKVDEKISLLTEKKDKLTEYKKGVMQQLFNGMWEEQDGQLTFIPPTLRFNADDGSGFPDWKEKKLGQVFTRIRRKNKENNQNVLTISAQQGLINQEKYFNKSVAAKDVTGYYLLENGDFAYNKSYSKGYPMGAIKRLNNYDKGVVSTLYICFGLNKGFVSDFFEHYFESGLQNRDLSKIAQEGARNHGLLNISVDEFFKDVKLLTPSHDEQLKIANFISAINQKIDLANSELEKAKEWKKGLLQQMFV